MQAAEAGVWWSWHLLACAVPLLALALWHCTDAFHCAVFAVRRYGRARLPPGHMGLPVVGETLAMLWYFKRARRPDGFVLAKRRRYGDTAGVYRTHIYGSPTVLVCSPAATRFVLQSPDSCFGMYWPAPELIGHAAMGNVEGALHKRLRRFILAAINHPASLQKIMEAVQPRVAAELRSWADDKGGVITAESEIRKVTFHNTCKMFVSLEPSPLTQSIDGWFKGLVAGFRALPLKIPGTAFHHAHMCRRELNAAFMAELERRKTEQADARSDLMTGLMGIQDEQGEKLSDEEVVDNIVTFVLAGYEFTSNAIMWAAYHLAKSPEALHKLREENLAISRANNGGFITLDDLPNMKYTAKVVDETIRLANVTPMTHRVAKKDVEYQGYTIPKGWSVLVWLRSLHTDPNNYDHPLKFIPERWDKPAKIGTYQVFGAGSRMCPGNMLAKMQITIMLHHLAVGYKWELLNPDAQIVYRLQSKPADGAAMSFSKL